MDNNVTPAGRPVPYPCTFDATSAFAPASADAASEKKVNDVFHNKDDSSDDAEPRAMRPNCKLVRRGPSSHSCIPPLRFCPFTRPVMPPVAL
jgi:hypothetical protein